MTEDSAPRLSSSPGYWLIVWRQLRQNRWAMGGLGIVGLFFATAFFAPFFAHRLPFYFTTADGETVYPLIREFFAPSESTEKVLEKAFNFVLLFMPVAVVLRLILPSWHDRKARWVSLTIGGILILAVWAMLVYLLVPIRYHLPSERWLESLGRYGLRETNLYILRIGILLFAGSTLTLVLYSGANEVEANPRWLVLTVAACLLSLPFFLTQSRNDQTPYRRLAKEGKGRGLFPLIPYGPNESGFGAKLTPSWWMSSSELTDQNIFDWVYFADVLRQKGQGKTPHPARRIWTLLRKEERAAVERIAESEEPAPEDTEAVRAGLNRLLAMPDFYAPDEWTQVRLQNEKDKAWLEKDPATLSSKEILRRNRRALEAGFLNIVEYGQFERAKRTSNLPGYHALGTDGVGRDVLVRLIHGARVSLAVGFISVGIATVIGLIIGSCAGYFGGRIDIMISRFMEIMMCFPTFFLILTIIAIMDKRSILNIMLVIGLTGWTGVARLIRGEVLKQKRLDYVASAQALGASPARIIFRHILPNAVAPVLVSVTFGIAGAILTEAGLSFLGFGVAPPTATWGQLLNEAKQAPLINWWLVIFPGLLIFISVTAYNLVGEGLRDAMDPRLRK